MRHELRHAWETRRWVFCIAALAVVALAVVAGFAVGGSEDDEPSAVSALDTRPADPLPVSGDAGKHVEGERATTGDEDRKVLEGGGDETGSARRGAKPDAADIDQQQDTIEEASAPVDESGDRPVAQPPNDDQDPSAEPSADQHPDPGNAPDWDGGHDPGNASDWDGPADP